MASRGRGKTGNRPVVVRRPPPAQEHGHHGGAWKIAYADFVTAMMAFFLLMWLVNATTDSQRRGISDYFAPTHIAARNASGSGEPFGGRSLHATGQFAGQTPLSVLQRPDAQPTDADDPAEETPTQPGRERPPGIATREPAPAPAEIADPAPPARAPSQQEAIARTSAEIRDALRSDALLAAMARQVLVEEVPEGLRVQLVDADGQPVFSTGQAAPNERGRALLLRIATILARLPYPVEITGHTDAAPFRGAAERSNWDLSADRANATRRLLLEGGVAESRIRAVAGRADREPLLAAQPLAAANRRVAVLMLMPPGGGSAP